MKLYIRLVSRWEQISSSWNMKGGQLPPPPPLEKTILKKPSFIRVKYLTALCGKLESWKLLNNCQKKP